MGLMIRRLGKIFCIGLSAVLGVAVGLVVFSSLMLMRVDGSSMLPTLEPGDRVLVLRNSALTGTLQLDVGDLVLYEAPYYTTDGEGLLKIRRVTGLRGSWVRLEPELPVLGDSQVLVRRTEVLGEVLVKIPGRVTFLP